MKKGEGTDTNSNTLSSDEVVISNSNIAMNSYICSCWWG